MTLPSEQNHRKEKTMAIVLRRANSLLGVTVILLLLLLLIFCPASSTGTVMEFHIHGYKNSSFMENINLSEWGLESENGRRLLQSKQYLGYGALDKDKAVGGASKPGNAYTKGCQASYYCRSD